MWKLFKQPYIILFLMVALSLISADTFLAEGIPSTPAPLSPEYPFEDLPNPGIPTLQEITVGATTDAAALAMIVDYYHDHEAWLRQVLQEDNSTRLTALYTMFVVHSSHAYGRREHPGSLIAYMQAPYSHCGIYSLFQAEILDAFGLTWRIFAHDGAEHVWMEVKVDGHWEVFDATVNVWIDQNGYELIDGAARRYRAFYSPLTDINRPDAREHYFGGAAAPGSPVGWFNMPRLRMWMPGLGLYYTPAAPPEEIGIYASSPGEGSDWNEPWIPKNYEDEASSPVRSICCAAA